MSHVDINLTHSASDDIHLGNTACDIWRTVLCVHIIILNFVIIQISQVKVYLHLGTYSLGMIEGMVYFIRIEKLLEGLNPLTFPLCPAGAPSTLSAVRALAPP